MLEDMHGKGQKEMEAEAKQFAVFRDWCKDTAREKEYNIQTAAAELERLEADIQAHEAAEMQLGDALAALDADIAQWQADVKAATELREGERADYEETERDYAESVDALTRAIAVLKSRQHDVKQADALLQKVASARRVSAASRAAVARARRFTPPEANAYEFQSSGIVDLLKKLKSQFVDEKNELEKAEMNNRHEFDMLSFGLKDQIKNAQKERGAKAAKKSEHAADRAEATGQHADTSAGKAEDEKYLKETLAQRDTKEISFAERQKLRGEELDALQQAIDIMSGEGVSGAADKHLPALVQRSLALRGTDRADRAPLHRVAALLARRGAALRSQALVQLAARAQADPLEKVRGMIRDLIAKLQEEAAAESEHKAWCDAELASNKQTREQKSEEVEALTAKADRLGAEISTLGVQIEDLTAAIAELDAAMAEATAVRQKEQATNEATIADAQAAQEAVKAALAVLKEFYAKAASATALVQAPAEDAPATFDAPYRGQQGSSTGVVGMIEVIQSDFSRLEAETKADEDLSAEEYAQFSEESGKDKASKTEAAKSKEKKRTSKEGDLHDTKKDLTAVQEELDSAMAYYDELKPACLEAGVSYEERVQRRKEELESLNEAWRILDAS